MSLLADEDRCSIRVHRREGIGKCKYRRFNVIKDKVFVVNSRMFNPHSSQTTVHFNPLVGRMDFPILIIWMSPLSFLGALRVIFHLYFIFR